MRFLLVVLFTGISFLGFGQTVSAPDPKSFLRNTSNQDASGFVLSGFNPTATLLCAIGLPQAPAGTTFNMTRFDGLTPASGFNFSGNKTRLVFTGTMANINIALATLRVNTPSTAGNIQISVSATVNPPGFFYNPNNGHFYRPVSVGATYSNAKLLSSQQTFRGQQGYLVTITSADEDNFIQQNVPQQNIWFALTDVAQEGFWRIDAGPENGTLIKTQNGQFNGNIAGQYNNWAGGEPNNAGGEHYAVTKWGGGTQWNDLPNHFNCAYVIEFGTWTNPDDQTFTEFFSNSTIYTNGETLRAQFTFEFSQGIDKTRFNTRLLVQSNNQYLPTTNITRTLNGLGRVDMTSDLDTVKIANSYKPHGIELNTTNNITTLYNSIVTVSDVFLAFKELSNGGLFGNETGLEFGNGIQFLNADIDENNMFDERDTYLLLQHLTGQNIIEGGSTDLSRYIKILPKSQYDQITKQNWNTVSNITNNIYSPINLSTATLLNTFTYNVFWKGDVNMSHSAPQPLPTTRLNQGSFIEAEMWTELKNGMVYVYINVNPLNNKLSGTQFLLNYDNNILGFDSIEFKTVGNPINFNSDRGTFINLGSIINNGNGILDDKTEYIIKFKPKSTIENSLGLVSIGNTDAVSSDGIQLSVKLK